jgi:hypothetical protein
MRQGADLEPLDFLSLIPYTKGELRKSRDSFLKQLLVPRRKRLAAAASAMSSTANKPKRTVPDTPPEIFQKSRRSAKGAKEVSAEEIREYEEYFRSSKYFSATGKLPDEWLIHLTDAQLQEVKNAREKVLKEKAAAGESAWQKWVEDQKRKHKPKALGDNKKGRKNGPLLSAEARWVGDGRPCGLALH